MRHSQWLKAAVCLLFATCTAAAELDIRGSLDLQARVFIESAPYGAQRQAYLSASVEPEIFWESESRSDSFLLVPFLRVDQYDSERTHADLREASWLHVGDNYEWRVGLRRVFWGKTEFQHLVDVINQIDGVEDIDGEDKLGQPMVNLSLVRDWGVIDFYLLPYFRERSFVGAEGRPRLPLTVDDDNPLYESSDHENHRDYAIRWSHYIGIFDFGLSWFKGTNRDPRLLTEFDPQNGLQLRPFYEQIEQVSFDGQATIDSWLLKAEALHRRSELERYWAFQGGFEYTLYGVMESSADVGVLLEYGWDERGEQASSTFQNDLFLGSRIALNDSDSSELLMGVGYDFDYQSSSVLIEASRRVGNAVKVSLDLRLFDSSDAGDSLFLFRKDDHLQLTVAYFF